MVRSILTFVLVLFLGWGFVYSPGVARAQTCGTYVKSVIYDCKVDGAGNCVSNNTDTFAHTCFSNGNTGACTMMFENLICGYDNFGVCRVIKGNPEYIEYHCGTGASSGGSCGDGAPACDGSCGAGQYCRAKVSNANECTCATAVDGCPGGWIFVGPNNSVRRCCVMEAPSAPSLISPANNAQLTNGNVTLSWTPPQNWGGDCPNMNPSEAVKIGTSPSFMNYIYRAAAPFPTSVAPAPEGGKVRIEGRNFPAPGTTVTVRLQYQSAPIGMSGYQALSPGWGWWETGPNNGGGAHLCIDMRGRPGWSGSLGSGVVGLSPDCAADHSGFYWDDIYVCKTWSGGDCPGATNRSCVTECNRNGVCHDSCTYSSVYSSWTGWYTAQRTHVGNYVVEAGGTVRIPYSALNNDINPSGKMSASMSSSGAGLPLNLAPGTYYWQAEADNGTNVAGHAQSSPIWSFTITTGVSGTVYYDPNNTCSTSTPTGLNGSMSVNYKGTYNATIPNSGASVGRFNVTETGSTTGDLTLNGIPPGYICSTGCSQSCPTKTNVISPSQSNNFFLTEQRSAWWQTRGAGVYAGSTSGGTTISSDIPPTVPAISRYLILPGTGGSPAAAVRASGSVSALAGSVNSSNWSAVSTYKGKKMDYKFFATQLGVTFSQTNDWGADTMNKPGNDPNKTFYYLKPASGTATITSPWTVASGESYVVLVDGDVRINSDISVANGGFLAIIASGNINVDPTVITTEGLYVTSGSFNTETGGSENDVQLNVAGSVVAWGGVNLYRDLGSSNVATPAELFSYRTDLLSNMPNALKTFVMTWEEVPAGSFAD